MTNQKLAILALVAAVLVGVAVMLNSTTNGPNEKTTGSAYLIQGLDPSQVTKITVEKGDEPITLTRQDNGFVIAEKSNYSANNKQINTLLTDCMDIQTTELVSQSQDNYSDLGVTEEKAKDVVKFFQADGALITGVIIGNSKEGGNGTYVRRIDSDKVYLTSKAPYIRKRALDYMEQNLIALNKENIESVQVTLPDVEYQISDDPNNGLQLSPLPEGRTFKSSDTRSVLSALTGLRFNDVQPKSTANMDFTQPQYQYQCRLKDSTVYTLKIIKEDDKYYVNCSSEYTDKSGVKVDRTKQDSEEELKAKEAKLLAQEKALKFSKRHSPWVYEIPEYKAKYLVKPLEDLLEQPKEETEDTEIQNLVPDLNSNTD